MQWWAPLLLLLALSIGFLGYSWSYPTYASIKASYMFPALLPLAFLTGEGLSAAAPTERALLRAALLAVAAGGTALTWWGWWFTP